jgi:NADH-quinone oxidoreductase subunit M
MSYCTILIFLPLLAALLVGLMPRNWASIVALAGSGLTFLIACLTLLAPSGATDGVFYQVQRAPWLPALGVHYAVGVDGPAAWLTVLTGFLAVFAILFPTNRISGREKGYFAALLVLEGTTIGAFCALDLVLFYVFFEACLLPVYYLIAGWGGPRRLQVAMKFFLYTVVGSLLMLAAILYLYAHARTTDYVALRAVLLSQPPPATVGLLLLAGFAAAFAVKTPLFPFHTWQADTYAESPTAGVMLLAGAMAKLGTFGFFRYCLGLFPDACETAAPLFLWLGASGVVYGALVASVQRDARRLLAFSSLSHLGFVVMGLFSGRTEGVTGALLQMIGHGITTGGLFLALGMLEDRRGTLRLSQLGGIWDQMPKLSRMTLILALSSIALPLTVGFVGEFLILLGTFQSYPGPAVLATTGVILSAVYMLWMFQRIMYGPVSRPENRRLVDIGAFEAVVLGCFVALVFLLGIQPGYVLRGLSDAVQKTLFQTAVASAPSASVPEEKP